MKKLITLISLMFILAVFCCGCGKEEIDNTIPGPSSVSYILAPTANSCKLNLSDETIQNSVYYCARNGGFLTMVSADSSPQVDYTYTFYGGRSTSPLSRTGSSLSEKYQLTMLYRMKKVAVNDPGVDFLEAFSVSLNSLKNPRFDNYAIKHIYVFGTGLSNTGSTLNFLDDPDLLIKDPQSVVASLKEKNALPNFQNTRVIWSHCGAVADPQPQLTSYQIYRLKNLWTAIIEASGGTVEFRDISPGEPDRKAKDYPDMSVVDLSAVIHPTESTNKENLSTQSAGSADNLAFETDTYIPTYPEEAHTPLFPPATP